jgi:BirA family biotin operon repressor/biotin-[acetyl-CoA-carboxylase] ligase
MSVLLFPSPRLRRPSLLTAWAAVSVCATIEQFAGVQSTIKWPNDVLIDGKKVCGILCEAGANHVVAGIGLNANQTDEDFGKMNLPDATSLALCAEKTIDVFELTQCLVGNLDRVYTRLDDDEVGEVESDWRTRIGLQGYLVNIEKMDGEKLAGTLRELSFEGVVVEQAGQLTNLAPEMIRHLRAGEPPA